MFKVGDKIILKGSWLDRSWYGYPCIIINIQSDGIGFKREYDEKEAFLFYVDIEKFKYTIELYIPEEIYQFEDWEDI